MNIDKKAVKESLKRWVTQTAREHHCKDEDIYPIAYNCIADILYVDK